MAPKILSMLLRNKYLSLIFFLCLFLFNFSCTADEGRGYPQQIDYLVNNPNGGYIALAQAGLDAWDIGLDSNRATGIFRNITLGYAYNPPNWITVTGANCEGGGISRSLQENCPFAENGVIGVCLLHVYSDIETKGQIRDSTIMVLDTFLTDIMYSDAEKLSVFIHEVGHCLGLQHWGNTDDTDSAIEPGTLAQKTAHVMYPNLSGADVPANAEIASLKAVYEDCASAQEEGIDCYNPISLDNISNCNISFEAGDLTVPYADYENYAPCYYSQRVITYLEEHAYERVYHLRFPEFTVSSSIGFGFSTGERYKKGEPVRGPSDLIIYYMKEKLNHNGLEKSFEEKIIRKF